MKNRLFIIFASFIILFSLIFNNQMLVSSAYSDVEINVYANYETAGINVKVPDLENYTNGTIEYRKVNTANWKVGHRLVKYDGNHMATSLFDLEKNTDYEVKVYLDGDQPLIETFRTKAEFAVPSDTGRNIVDVSNAAGLTLALSSASPNTTIKLAAGDYEGGFALTGKSDVVIKSATSVKSVIKGRITITECENIFLDNIEATKSLNLAPSVGQNDAVGIVNSENVSVSNCYIHDSGSNVSDYRGNIDIKADFSKKTAGHTIINNIICDADSGEHYSGGGTTYFGIKIGQSGALVNNAFITIRDNYIYNLEDGIHTGSDEKTVPVLTEDAENYLTTRNGSQEFDFYDNVIFNCKDDCIETDGHMVNGRYFRNRLGKCTNSISTASTYPGPNFFVRNIISGFTEGFNKQNTGGDYSTGGSSTAMDAEVTRKCFFYNNTIVEPEKTSNVGNCFYRNKPAKVQDMTYINNIFYARGRVYNTDFNIPNNDGSYFKNQVFNYNLLYTDRTKPNDPVFAKVPDSQGTATLLNQNTFSGYLGLNVGDAQSINYDPEINMSSWYYDDLPQDVKSQYPSGGVSLGLLVGEISNNSPAKDAGTIVDGISNIISGDYPDIGAFEVDAPLDPTPIPTVTPTPTATPTPTVSPTPTVTPTPTQVPSGPFKIVSGDFGAAQQYIFNFDNAFVNNNIVNWDLSKIKVYTVDVRAANQSNFTSATPIGTLASYTINGNINGLVQGDFRGSNNSDITDINALVNVISIRPDNAGSKSGRLGVLVTNAGKGIFFVFEVGAITSPVEGCLYETSQVVAFCGYPNASNPITVFDFPEPTPIPTATPTPEPTATPTPEPTLVPPTGLNTPTDYNVVTWIMYGSLILGVAYILARVYLTNRKDRRKAKWTGV